VDAARPESETARQFSLLIDKLVAGNCNNPELMGRVRSALVVWRDNDAQLQTVIARSFLLNEAAPISRNLTAVANVGLDALDHFRTGEPANAGWKVQQVAIIAEAEKPTSSQSLLMIAPPVQTLVEGASKGGRCTMVR